MSPKSQTLEFQAETRQLLDLMIHSLYSNKEIFLRELISNASDALDKLRFAQLTEKAFEGQSTEFEIELAADPKARTLTVSDNGIGMTRDEIVANLGTIARSGTRQFLEELKAGERKAAEIPQLIGQFGVGFYSAFMVAEQVTVETRKAGSDEAWRWTSSGDGKYSLEPCDKQTVGTVVTLALKDIDPDEAGATDYTQEWVLRQVVKRYSDFVEYPIRMQVERTEIERDEAGKPVEGGEKQTIVEKVTLNSMRPLWTRPRGEITAEEHAEFYKHLAHDWEPPLEPIHLKAEGAIEYTALLYLPKRRPMGLFDPNEAKSRVQLYVKRVFITADCEELMPTWLRFVPGIVDSSDLPLNVSRETLQHARQLGQIRKRLVKKTIDTFASLATERREDYENFWSQFGPVIKEGLYYDDDNREALAKTVLFRSSKVEGWTSLDQYLERRPDGQTDIYVLAGPDLKAVQRSPHLEAFTAKGFEVLFLTDQVDEFAFQRLTEYAGAKIRSIAKGQVDLEDSQRKAAREEAEQQHGELLTSIQEALAEHVEAVRFSNRLTDSAAVLVSGEHAMAPHVERMMREAGQGGFGMPESKRTLELNPEHAIVKKLADLQGTDKPRFDEYCSLLYGQALLTEGSPLPDPVQFSKLVSKLMVD